MGKASKWFRGILRLKRADSSSPTPTGSASTFPNEKRRWSFVKCHRQNDGLHAMALKIGIENDDNHAVVVPAGAAVVTVISNSGCAGAAAQLAGYREEWAAVKIQSAFRGCLARRALRALKGLVKLQALVRGHIERKRTAQWLQKIQLFLRAQARAQAGRAQFLLSSSSSAKSSNLHLQGPATPEKIENPVRSKSMKYGRSSIIKVNGNQEKCWGAADVWVDEKSWNRQRSSVRTCVHDERNVRSMETDSGKPHSTPKRRARNLFQSADHALVSDHYSLSLTTSKDSATHHSGRTDSFEVEQSYSPLKDHEAEDSPQYFSASPKDGESNRCPFTPTGSDGSRRSYLSGYSEYPNYMACTESSKAKVRSLSAPKQRPQYERSGSSTSYSISGSGESRLSAPRASDLHASFTSKAYPGSGRLDKLGMPAEYRC